MSDGAGAPGGAAPVAPAGQPTTHVQSKTPPAPKAPKTDAPSWSEKDDADLIERFKRSPHGRLKVDGKDEPIDSIDSLKRTLLDAQRGRGANRLVEQTKKEAAEAKKMAEETKAERELIARARKGDPQARRELGLIPDEERQRTEQEWAALPPEVQAVIRENHEMAQRLKAHEDEKSASLKEREANEKKATRDATLKTAKELSASVLKDVREELYDVELPEVLLAMETLKASGARLGKEYTTEQLAAYIEQQREAGVWERVGRTKPAAALQRIAPMLKGLKPAELQEALGEHFVPLAKLFSAQWIAHNKAGKARAAAKPAGTAAPVEQPKKSEPLSPFKFRPR